MLISLVLFASVLGALGRSDDRPPGNAKETGIEVTDFCYLFPPGSTESQGRAVAGDTVVGRLEVFDTAAHSVYAGFFVDRRGSFMVLEKFANYRELEILAVSASGVVVGYATGPVGSLRDTVVPYAYDIDSRAIVDLPLLEGFSIGMASDISAQGDRVVGNCGGTACVWNYEDDQWVVRQLRVDGDKRSTMFVTISPNGRIAAASLGGSGHGAEVVVWRYSSAWAESQAIATGSYTVRDINDSGALAVDVSRAVDGIAVTRGQILNIETAIEVTPLPGDNFTSIRSLNNDGIAVGWSDRTGDKEGFPRAIVWDGEHCLPLLIDPQHLESHQAYAVDDEGTVVGVGSCAGAERAVGFQLRIDSAVAKHPQR